jgi:outer membrane protein OmpU
MKKVLMGTTALIAATFASQAARADDQPVKLSISGVAQFAYGVAVSEKQHSNNLDGTISRVSSDRLPDSAKTYTNLDISGDAKFKNGLTAGVFIEISAQPLASGSNGGWTGTAQVKQDWVHIKGDSFGEVRMGDFTDARRISGMAAPTWSPNYFLNANSPDVAFIGGGAASNTTTAYFGNRFMTEVAYFSPTFDGAQLVLSYAPDNGTFSSAGPGSNVTTAPGLYLAWPTSIRDIFSGAVSWSGTVSGVTVSAEAGLTTGSAKKGALVARYVAPANANPFAWDGGVTLGYGPWLVGAAYEQTSNLAGSFGPIDFSPLNPEQVDKTLDVGFNYTIGNLTTGIEWSHGIYEGGLAATLGGAYTVNTSTNPKSHYILDTITPGASYVIGPGVDIDAGVAYNVIRGNGFDATMFSNNPAGTGQTRGQDIVLEFGTEVKF